MSTFVPAKLRQCPECGGRWPNGPDYDLRGCGWLADLPRKVSPSNDDLTIHDGAHGVDRFLLFDFKGPRESWPVAPGIARRLAAQAALQRWTVRILRGRTDRLDVYRVTSDGVESEPRVRTHAEAIRRAVSDWLNGQPWRDDALTPVEHDEFFGHTCGWARVDGIWTCTQDYYAAGFRPDTACGKTLPEFA